MRRAIGQTWIMQLMIIFILLFAGYIILTLNYSRTVKVKNEVISIVEKYEGLNDYSIGLVNSYLATSGYNVSGVCTSKSEEGIYGGDLASNKLEKAESGKKYNYCFKKYQGISVTNYYQITLFYKFNLPVIGNASGFSVKGTTNSFKSYDEEEYERVIGS